jgi:type II secretory pathway pseudopilin PulG
MSPSRGDHNIYGSTLRSRIMTCLSNSPSDRAHQGGYTLVAMLAVMTLMALIALAAAPSISQQAQREREKEAIYRGEQVADAIREYYIYRSGTLGVTGDQALPTSMDQLLEGIPVTGGSKKRQILRASAAHDPLSSSGEWALARPRSQKLVEFQRSLMLYSRNVVPVPGLRQIADLQRLMAPPMTNILGVPLTKTPTTDDDALDESSGPFIGVTSRSQKKAVMHYYGIEQHNEWIFTPLFRW